MAPRHPSRSSRSGNRAQLPYTASTHDWSLRWADRNGRWHHYDDLPPGRIEHVLQEIESDPTGIFWG